MLCRLSLTVIVCVFLTMVTTAAIAADATLEADLQDILDWCEAYHYGGIDTNGSGQDSLGKMLDNARVLFKEIDKCFKK